MVVAGQLEYASLDSNELVRLCSSVYEIFALLRNRYQLQVGFMMIGSSVV